jgi:hypothetical protein
MPTTAQSLSRPRGRRVTTRMQRRRVKVGDRGPRGWAGRPRRVRSRPEPQSPAIADEAQARGPHRPLRRQPHIHHRLAQCTRRRARAAPRRAPRRAAAVRRSQAASCRRSRRCAGDRDAQHGSGRTAGWQGGRGDERAGRARGEGAGADGKEPRGGGAPRPVPQVSRQRAGGRPRGAAGCWRPSAHEPRWPPTAHASVPCPSRRAPQPSRPIWSDDPAAAACCRRRRAACTRCLYRCTVAGGRREAACGRRASGYLGSSVGSSSAGS